MSALRLHGVTKRFGSLTALDRVDLDVEAGSSLAVLGPSGSGKSTLLRLIAGLEAVDAGTIELGGRDVTETAPAARAVSMVFQGYALFPHLTVADNIGFGFAVRRTDKATAATAVRDAARLAGCDHLLERRPDQLSGGERQRVALARAMARSPEVFLLDEPLSSLDAQRRVETRAEIQRVHHTTGTTMLYVTHDQVEALTIGDRVAVLAGGRVHQIGTPDEIYWQPADKFVAAFIGTPTINLLPAHVTDGQVRAGGFSVAAGVSTTGPVELGIRPEHVRVSRDTTGPPHGFSATVEMVEPVGPDAHLHLSIDRDSAEPTTLLARVPNDDPAQRGEQVWVHVPDDRCYVFDANGSTVQMPALPRNQP